MEIANLATDPNLEKEGVWVDYGDYRVKLRRWNNPECRAMIKRLSRPYRHFRDGLPDDVNRRLTAQVLAETIVVDWEGLTKNGKPLKFDAKTAQEIFVDPKMTDFTENILTAAQSAEAFRVEALEATGKN